MIRLADRLAQWSGEWLARVGYWRNADGVLLRRGSEDAWVRQQETALAEYVARADDETLRAHVDKAARVANTMNTPGWRDILTAHENAVKNLFENFVDGSVKTWDESQLLRGRIAGHREKLGGAYELVKLGGLAEAEMETRRTRSGGE